MGNSKRKKELDLRCALKSRRQREAEIRMGVEAFKKDREDEDLLLV